MIQMLIQNVSNFYHGHFIGGPNQFDNQTNNCLIVKKSATIPIVDINTPLGLWMISGSGVGKYEQIEKILDEHLGLQPFILQTFGWLLPLTEKKYLTQPLMIRLHHYSKNTKNLFHMMKGKLCLIHLWESFLDQD